MDPTVGTTTASFSGLSLPSNEPPASLPWFRDDPFRTAEHIFDDVPPFLFRLHCSGSPKQPQDGWIRSRDADDPDPNIRASSRRAARDRPPAEVADALNRHLWWSSTEPGHSNFVSWTTSLLFALRLASRHYDGGIPPECIHLTIVNTKKFPERVFVRDLHLIRSYQGKLSTGGGGRTLASLLDLRHTEYYFGEFLSQGALRVEGKSSTVSLTDPVFGGLFQVHQVLAEHRGDMRWANWVRNERTRWTQDGLGDWAYPTGSSPCPAELSELTLLFKPEFRLPVAAALLSLQPRNPADPQLLDWLVSLAEHTDREALRHYYSPPFNLGLDLHAMNDRDERMPELQQQNALITNAARVLWERGAPEGLDDLMDERRAGCAQVAWIEWSTSS